MQKIKEFFRKPQVWGFFVSIAVMAALSLAFFAPDVFEGGSLQQADVLQGLANGHEGQVYEQATGEKALWTNSLFGGMPTFQISPSYPSNRLFAWLNTVYGLGLPSPANLLFMMMFGFLILLYALRMRWPYALLGAIAWGFSSYFVIIIGAGHIWKFLALTYIPPTIAGLILCYRGRLLPGAALLSLFAMLQLNANHPQMSYYFALVMLALVIGWLVEAYRDKKMRQWLMASLVTLGCGALAIGANLPSLYNTYEYSKETKRSASELSQITAAQSTTEKATKGLSRSDILNWSYAPSETFSLLIPDIKGGASARPKHGQLTSLALSDLDAAKEYAGQPGSEMLNYLPPYFGGPEGTNGPVYVGAIVVMLFILGCIIVKGPVKWALLVSTVVAILLSWGYNMQWLSDLMIDYMPMYSKFRAVESILVVVEFTMPLLAVMGLYQLLTTPNGLKVYIKPVLWAVGLPVLICLCALIVPSIFGSPISDGDLSRQSMLQRQLIDMANSYGMDPTQTGELLNRYSVKNPDVARTVSDLRFGLLQADALRSLFFVVLGAVLIGLALLGKIKARVAVLLLGAATAVDLYQVDKRYVSHESFAEAAEARVLEPDAIDNLILADTAQSYRVMDATQNFMDYRRSYFHKTIGGYHAAKLNRYEDLLQHKLQVAAGVGYYPELRDDSIAATYGPDQREMVSKLREAYRVLDMLNARYVITDEEHYPVLPNPYALGNAWLVDSVVFVKDAVEEMAALGKVDPARIALADERSESRLAGAAHPTAAGDTIYLTRYTPNALTYHAAAAAPALAVFSEVWFPWGWHATIDGKPAEISRVNYLLRAIALPEGSHTVEMKFDPQSLHVTGAIAYGCVTLIYLLIALALFKACTACSKD